MSTGTPVITAERSVWLSRNCRGLATELISTIAFGRARPSADVGRAQPQHVNAVGKRARIEREERCVRDGLFAVSQGDEVFRAEPTNLELPLVEVDVVDRRHTSTGPVIWLLGSAGSKVTEGRVGVARIEHFEDGRRLTNKPVHIGRRGDEAHLAWCRGGHARAAELIELGRLAVDR